MPIPLAVLFGKDCQGDCSVLVEMCNRADRVQAHLPGDQGPLVDNLILHDLVLANRNTVGKGSADEILC